MKKMLWTVLLAAILCLCACANETEETTVPELQTVETAGYCFSLPEGWAAEKLPDGGVRLSREGTEIGGVQIVPFADAEALDAEAKLGRPFGPLYDQLKEQIIPEGMCYMADSSITTAYTIEVSIGPDSPETRSMKSTYHFYFPAGEQFYDLWYQERVLEPEEENAIVDSFAVKA